MGPCYLSISHLEPLPLSDTQHYWPLPRSRMRPHSFSSFFPLLPVMSAILTSRPLFYMYRNVKRESQLSSQAGRVPRWTSRRDEWSYWRPFLFAKMTAFGIPQLGTRPEPQHSLSPNPGYEYWSGLLVLCLGARSSSDNTSCDANVGPRANEYSSSYDFRRQGSARVDSWRDDDGD